MPNPMKIASCLSILLLTACGQDPKTKTVEVEKKPWYEGLALDSRYSSDAIILSPAHINCSTHVDGFVPSSVNKVLRGHSSLTTSDTLLIEDHSVKQETNSKVLVQESREFFVCAEGAPDNSLESMAEKIIGDIDTAHAYYLRAAGTEALPLPKVDVEVQPLDQYKSYYRFSDEFIAQNQLSLDPISVEPFMVSGAEVNNAYYAPNIDSPLIAFLPHSDESTSFPSALWKMPLVARHEYGHHVFFQHMKSVFGAFNFDYRQLVLENPKRHGVVAPNKRNAAAGDSFPRFDAYFLLAALNEGFADIFAHETFEGSSYGIESPCFGITRNVTSEYLNGGVYRKAWTGPLLDYMMGRSKTIPTFEAEGTFPGCGSFSVYSPHHIGSLIAHSTYKVLSASDLVRDLPKKDEGRFNLSLAWLKKINETMDPASDGPYRFLSTILLASVEVARAGSAPNAELCAVIGEQFPGFKELWTKQAVDPTVLACLK